MRASEIRQLTDKELNDKLVDLKKELFNLRFQQATGNVEDSNAIGNTKRDIARVKTVQKERELKIAKEA